MHVELRDERTLARAVCRTLAIPEESQILLDGDILSTSRRLHKQIPRFHRIRLCLQLSRSVCPRVENSCLRNHCTRFLALAEGGVGRTWTRRRVLGDMIIPARPGNTAISRDCYLMILIGMFRRLEVLTSDDDTLAGAAEAIALVVAATRCAGGIVTAITAEIGAAALGGYEVCEKC